MADPTSLCMEANVSANLPYRTNSVANGRARLRESGPRKLFRPIGFPCCQDMSCAPSEEME